MCHQILGQSHNNKFSENPFSGSRVITYGQTDRHGGVDRSIFSQLLFANLNRTLVLISHEILCRNFLLYFFLKVSSKRAHKLLRHLQENLISALLRKVYFSTHVIQSSYPSYRVVARNHNPFLSLTSIYLQFIMPDAFQPHGAILSGSVWYNLTR
jgi:hypothetical protein